MANKIYDTALYDVMAATWDWLNVADFSVALLNAAYTYSPTHAVLADVSGNFLSGMTPQLLVDTTLSSGATPVLAGANSVTFSGVTAGQTCKAIVVYYNAGSGRLIAYYDTGTGLTGSFTTTGADITIDWNGIAVAGTLISVAGP